ncbi:MAG TPA: hypothetical protein VEK07_00540 [Polyangiaceae bacterium]|nr:hypothetical protein [Polyangiaceae bacterium]
MAHAALRVKWDCYLPSGGIDCSSLESSLTSKIPFVSIVAEPKNADVTLTLTSVPAENGTRYKCDLVGKRIDGYATEVHAADKIPSSIDTTTAMVRIMTKLERGLADFMDQKVAAEVEHGTLTIRLIDPVQPPFSGRPEQSGVRWYVMPAVGTYLSEVEGVGVNANGNASLSFNDSEPSWRVQQWIGASYSEQSQPVPGTNETASISFAGGNADTVLSWSVTRDDRWNAGLLLSAEKNPQANYKLRANGSAGLEFDLVPRQTVNQQNLGFRCAVGAEFQHYDETNVEGITEQAVGRQFCDTFLSWHFVPVDLWASIGETTVLKNLDFRGFSSNLSAAWRLTDNLTISPWISLQQINRAINEAEPSTVVYTDPRQEIEASMLAAVQQGYTAPFGVQSGLSIRYMFGNGSLSSEDQRWKNASNLR